MKLNLLASDIGKEAPENSEDKLPLPGFSDDLSWADVEDTDPLAVLDDTEEFLLQDFVNEDSLLLPEADDNLAS